MKVMSAIESCRTAALGGHVARCEGCAHTIIATILPQPALPKVPGRGRTAMARRARSRVAARAVLPCGVHAAGQDRRHRLSEQGRDLRPAVQGIRRDAITIAADPKYLGARIGITTVLHTWGSAMTHHPHVHMIVPGGGISLDGERVGRSCRCRATFRRCRCSRVCSGDCSWTCSSPPTHAGQLKFFGQHVALAQRKAFIRSWRRCARLSGSLQQAAFRGTRGGARYLSRYTHRIAISNRRLVAAMMAACIPLEGLSRRRSWRWKTMTLAPPSLSAGSWSTCYRRASIASATTGCSPTVPEPRASPRRAICSPRQHAKTKPDRCSRCRQHRAADCSRPCPCCGGRMIIIEVFARGGAPDIGTKPSIDTSLELTADTKSDDAHPHRWPSAGLAAAVPQPQIRVCRICSTPSLCAAIYRRHLTPMATYTPARQASDRTRAAQSPRRTGRARPQSP